MKTLSMISSFRNPYTLPSNSTTHNAMHCFKLTGNKKRKFNFRFKILYAKLDASS